VAAAAAALPLVIRSVVLNLTGLNSGGDGWNWGAGAQCGQTAGPPPTAAAVRDSGLFPTHVRIAAAALAAFRAVPAGLERVEAAAAALGRSTLGGDLHAGPGVEITALLAPAAAHALCTAVYAAVASTVATASDVAVAITAATDATAADSATVTVTDAVDTSAAATATDGSDYSDAATAGAAGEEVGAEAEVEAEKAATVAAATVNEAALPADVVAVDPSGERLAAAAAAIFTRIARTAPRDIAATFLIPALKNLLVIGVNDSTGIDDTDYPSILCDAVRCEILSPPVLSSIRLSLGAAGYRCNVLPLVMLCLQRSAPHSTAAAAATALAAAATVGQCRLTLSNSC